MPIRLACPHCGTTLTVPDHLSGKSVRCGKCAQLIGVAPPVGRLEPAPLPANSVASPAVKVMPAVARAPAAPKPSASPPPKSPAASLGPAVLVGAAVGLVVVVIGLTGGYFLFFRGSRYADQQQVVDAKTENKPTGNQHGNGAGATKQGAAAAPQTSKPGGAEVQSEIKADEKPAGTADKKQPPQKPIDTKYISAEFAAAVVVRPNAVLQTPLVSSLLPPTMLQAMVQEAGFSPDQVEQLIVFLQPGAAI